MNSFLKPPKPKKYKMEFPLVIVSWLLFFLLCAVFVFLYFSRILTIKHINCNVASGTCPDYVEAELNKLQGKFIFSDEVSSQVERIRTYMPSLHEYQILRQLPDKIEVSFSSSAMSYLLTDGQKTTWVVDESGTIIDQQSVEKIPTVLITSEFAQSLQLRSQVDENVHNSILVVLQKVSEYGIDVQSMNMDAQDEVKLTLADGKIVLLPMDQIEVALEKLRLVLRGVDFEHLRQPVHVIDVRFKYPILKERI
jgi:cell division septal protein FtsQ